MHNKSWHFTSTKVKVQTSLPIGGGNSMLLDAKEDHILYSLEQNDVLIIPSVGSVSLFQFLSQLEGKKTLFVSDDIKLGKIFGSLVYQKSIYDNRFQLSGSSWLTYDLALFILRNNPDQFQNLDFIVINDVDYRSFKCQIFLLMIENLRSKLIIPVKSTYKIDTIEKYFKDSGKNTTKVDLIEQYPVSTYYHQTQQPNKLDEIINLLKKIFELDKSSQYDILIITSDNKLQSELPLISLKPNVSIIRDVSKYKISEKSPRRLIFHDRASDLLEMSDNNVKYVIDTGDVEQVHYDELNDSAYIKNRIFDKNVITQSINLLSSTQNSKYFALFHSNDIKEFNTRDGNISALLLLLLDSMKLDDVKFIKKPDESIVRDSLNQLVYMGLITVINNEPVITDLAKRVLKFQFEYTLSNLSLFVALIHSISYNCSNELLKIISILFTLNNSKLSIYLKGFKSENDFLTMILIFDEIIDNNQVKADKHTFKFNSFFNSQDKKLVLHTYNSLRRTLESPINKVEADESTVLKCLVIGYQFQTGALSIDFESSSQAIVPIFYKHNKMIKISPINTLSNNDLMIFHTNSKLYNVINEKSNVHHQRSDQSRDSTSYSSALYVDFKGKIPKKIVHEVNLSLFKWR